MSYQVVIRQCEAPLEVQMGKHLGSRFAAGLGVSAQLSCRQLQRRKSRLYSGEVEMSPTPNLRDRSGKDNGMILACRAVPWSNCEIAWLSEEDRIVHPPRHCNAVSTKSPRATHAHQHRQIACGVGRPLRFFGGQLPM